jgi:thiol-disulfide isomerase/thioredoxin
MKLNLSQRPRTKTLLFYVAEVFVFALVLFAIYAYQTRNLLPADLQAAPVLHASNLDGTLLHDELSDATATLVYFFAPWCNICAASSGNIHHLRKLRSEKDLKILLVALDWQTLAEVREYVDRNEITVPVVLGDRRVAQDWNIYAFPTYYILNSQRQIVRRDLGYSTLAGLWWRTIK